MLQYTSNKSYLQLISYSRSTFSSSS